MAPLRAHAVTAFSPPCGRHIVPGRATVSSATSGSGPSVADPATRSTEQVMPAHAGVFHRVLLDDNQHSYAYVIEMLGRIFGYGRDKAFVLASIVDGEGRVIVETGSHEQVTRHQSQIHAYGADPRIPASLGSMSAVIEPADSTPG